MRPSTGMGVFIGLVILASMCALVGVAWTVHPIVGALVTAAVVFAMFHAGKEAGRDKEEWRHLRPRP